MVEQCPYASPVGGILTPGSNFTFTCSGWGSHLSRDFVISGGGGGQVLLIKHFVFEEMLAGEGLLSRKIVSSKLI